MRPRLLLSALFSTANAIPTISIKGSKFFNSDGDQFYIKGVVYQANADQNGLTIGDNCKRDAQLIKELGGNVVRVYSVDPTLNHDTCMEAFEEAGIYVMIDMAALGTDYSFNRVDPQWTKNMRNNYAAVIDGFQKYNNTLGFFAGNEVVNDEKTTPAAAYVKAAIADMKAYRDLMQYRAIPIGYAAADVEKLRNFQQDWFDCGDASMAADFFGQNRYTWCGESSFEESGYEDAYKFAEGYDVPIFFSENGCHPNTSSNDRAFDDQIVLFGREMNDRFSGNIIYELTQEENEYGLVSYQGNSASTMGDYDRLKGQWATLTPAGIKESDYTPTGTRRACPGSTSGLWSIDQREPLPTIGLEGFTTPTASRTSAFSDNNLLSALNTAASGTPTGSLMTSNATQGAPSSKTPIGAIVGGVLGGLVVIIAILLGILFLLRRQKKQRAAHELDSSRSGGESGKMVAGSEDEERKANPNGYYGPRYHEVHSDDVVPELDPAHGHTATMRAPEMQAGTGQMGELPNGQQIPEQYAPAPGGAHLGAPSESAPIATTAGPSPYVQAQRKVEMDWLETEEARLRERRALLMRQAEKREAGG